jgi:hypothetical protein
MSHSDGRNLSYARKDIFFLVRVLVKARFSNSKTTNPKFRTVLFTTRYQRNYVENFSSLGAIAAEKWETDGRTVLGLESVTLESRNLGLTRTLTKKIHFYKHYSSSCYQNWTFGTFERSHHKNCFQLKTHGHQRLWPTLYNPAKVPKFPYTA